MARRRDPQPTNHWGRTRLLASAAEQLLTEVEDDATEVFEAAIAARAAELEVDARELRSHVDEVRRRPSR